MAHKTFKRIYRSARVPASQAARDDEIRRQVKAEFPPLESGPTFPVLSDPLKIAIKRSGKTVGKLAKEANVSPIVLKQFMAGHGDLRLATAEKLAQVLGLKLVAS